MQVEIKNITPVIAKKLLSKNTKNRKINKAQLEMIKRSMLDGRWRLTHQGIALYKNGDIADGQHRLTAIVETGITCKMPLFKDIDNDINTVLAIDCGKNRTVKDGATISGYKMKASDVALAKGFEFGYEGKLPGNFPRLTHMESYDLAIKHKSKISATNRIINTSCKNITIASVKVAVGVIWNENMHREADIKSFCKTLITGEYSTNVMINAVKLRNKLLTDRYSGDGLKGKAYSMTFYALSKTLEGNKIGRIKLK